MPREMGGRALIGSQRHRQLPALPSRGVFQERHQAFLGGIALLTVCAVAHIRAGGPPRAACLTPAT